MRMGARAVRDRALGLLAIALGLALAVAVQARWPVGVPLYDGVTVNEPYRFLHPAGGQAGDPTSFEATSDVVGGVSPAILAATTENPPQAQLVAGQDAFEVPGGTTELKVSITPVETTVEPEAGELASNVYRFAVTDTAGAPVTPKPCGTCRTLVLRVTDEALEAHIAHLENGAWKEVQTLHAGLASMLQINAPAMGDYAVVAVTTPNGDGGGGADALIFGAIALALFFAAVAGLFWYRRRPPPVPVAQLGPGRGRIPSKRKAPRRPPSGRSGE
jgi:hypothetical protein